jgi:ketosteroid isomerase-like protein
MKEPCHENTHEIDSGRLFRRSGLYPATEPAPETRPQHQKLQLWAGEWSYEGESQTTFLGPSEKFTGRMTGRSILNGFGLESVFNEQWPSGEVQTVEVNTYDPVTKSYPNISVSSDGSFEQGSFTVTGSVATWAGTLMVNGKWYKDRGTDAVAPDGMSITKHGEISVDGETWVPWFTLKAAKAQDSEKSAVEATVRGFEQAVQDFNRAKVDSFLTPDARWIENSLPEKFDDAWQPFDELKAAGIRITYRPHDFETHVQGDVAWVTLTIDGTFSADSAEGQKLLLEDPASKEACLSQATHVSCEVTFVESEVLVKAPSGWKIALGNTSSLPKAKK